MKKDPRNITLEDLHLEKRVINILKNNGIRNAYEIVRYQNTGGLTELRGINISRFQAIIAGMVEYAGMMSPSNWADEYERWVFPQTKPVLRVFIAQPLNGIPYVEQIRTRVAAMQQISTFMEEKYPDHIIKFLDQIHVDDEVAENIAKSKTVVNERLFWLGRSISLFLSKAHFVYFTENADEAKGCQVERYIAEMYQVSILNDIMSDDENK